MTSARDNYDRWLGLMGSVGLHAGIVVGVFVAPSLFGARTATWGSRAGGTGGVNIKIVSNMSGIALPSPAVTADDGVVSETKSLYKSEPAPKVTAPVIPDPEAIQLPSKTAPLKNAPSKDVRTKNEAKKPVPEVPSKVASNTPVQTPAPSNAVPYGQGGGNPAIRYGQAAPGTGPTGAEIGGDGTFGDRYGTYVDAMTRAITDAWRGINVSQQRAPRVYVIFTISRTGQVTDAALQQQTNNPTVMERAALRAVNTAKMPPLPSDYHGPPVTVRFYFDYVQ